MTTINDTSMRKARVGLIGLGLFAAIFIVGLLWAKWAPYTGRALTTSNTRTWSGTPIFQTSGAAGSAPTFRGAWDFTVSYLQSVWRAALVGLLVAAAIDGLVKPTWLLRMMNRRTRWGQALAGGLTSLPSMMCTCCTAPVTVGMRKRGVSTVATLAYWIGNPILNPAVLVFLFLVAPWQFAAVRLSVGALLVFGGTTLVARLAGRREPDGHPGLPVPTEESDQYRTVTGLLRRFARSLVRFSLVLIPEYVVMVFLVGLFSGTLSDFFGLSAQLGLVSVLLVAVIATALVIPTAGEIPVVLGLVAVGAGGGIIGVLLIALPALSLPSIVMVGRALSWRVTMAAAAAVVMAAMIAGSILAALWPGI